MAKAEPGRWLKHKKDGTIYGYTDVMAKNPAVEEVSAEIAFPEKHIPAKQEGREARVNLSTDEKLVKKASKKPNKKTELNIEASRGV